MSSIKIEQDVPNHVVEASSFYPVTQPFLRDKKGGLLVFKVLVWVGYRYTYTKMVHLRSLAITPDTPGDNTDIGTKQIQTFGLTETDFRYYR